MAVVFNENIPDITLYTCQSPSGIKISIALEELGLPYEVKKIDPSHPPKDAEWFSALNPTGRIPFLTDTFGEDAEPITLFETGSILQYLIEQYDPTHKISYPKGTREAYEINNWLFSEVSILEAKVGAGAPPAVNGDSKKSGGGGRMLKKLYAVLDQQLANSKGRYLVGDKCTVADIAHWGWVASATEGAGWDVQEYPHLREWALRVLKREGVERGRHVPDPHAVKQL